jgi:MSHA pilin protein MshD
MSMKIPMRTLRIHRTTPGWPGRQRGVSLVELVISIVLLGIVAAGMASAFASLMRDGTSPLWHGKAMKLGQLYLDEILAKAYDHNTPLGGVPPVAAPDCSAAALGPESGETRATYNDVDDYHGIGDAPPVSLIGSLDSSYADYSIKISVECDGTSVGASGQAHAKLIVVSVYPPERLSLEPMVFSAYRGNF